MQVYAVGDTPSKFNAYSSPGTVRLTDDELKEVLARAEEIQGAANRTDAANAEMRAVVAAAGEVGIDPKAVEQALRERFELLASPPGVGDLTFARSTDGKYYVAELLSMNDDGARVRFLRGSEAVVTLDRLRPCALLPGETVVVNWPDWGKWTSTVVSFNAETRRVIVSDGWGSRAKLHLSDVWLEAPRNKQDKFGGRTRARIFAAGAAAGLTLGAVIGALVSGLLFG